MAGFGDTMAADYQVASADFGETVTYRQDSTNHTVTDTVALEISRREVQDSNGFFSYQDLTFLLPVAKLGGVTPKEGDKITRADSTVWSVFPTRLDAAGNEWRVNGKKER